MISDNKLMLRLVTPSGPVLEATATSVAMWTAMGEIEVLPGHAPTVVVLEPGEMRVRDGAGAVRVFVAGEGFARIEGSSVTIFSDMAEDAAGIDMDEAEEAKRRAEEALANAGQLSEDERNAQDLVRREAVVKLEWMSRRRSAS